MRVPELLAPAGGPDELNAALAAGADAVYCGFGTTFNARRGATSFTSQTFAEACRRAHLCGARVYVTVNVVIRDDEMPSVLALVRRAWLLGADAFIIQDWGLLDEVHRRWPEVACHVSTQANVHDVRGVAWCRELGAERVTTSRELSVGELELLSREGVPIECFCHGAICVCYSGICHMSSSAGNRSANRGECAQPCRLPYELVDRNGKVLNTPDRGRPLCPRDYYSFDTLPELADAGVVSLKVEGRLKGPDYVYAVIKSYREQLDDLAADVVPDTEVLAARRTRLRRAFNRDFTDAYLRGTSADELMSYERSNNRGELVGTAVGSRDLGTVKMRRGGAGGGRSRLRTASVADVEVVLDKPVGKGDLLELRPLADPTQFVTAHAQSDAEAGQVITCRTTRVMPKGTPVRVIRSQAAMAAGVRAAENPVPRRRQVRVRVRARLDEPFEVSLSTCDGRAQACATGFVVEAARTRSVTADDLVAHVGRMGNTWFEPREFVVELDEGCGMGFSAVHAVRDQACAALEQALLEPYAERTLGDAPSRQMIHAELARLGRDEARDRASVCADEPLIAVLAPNAEAACAAIEEGAQRVYATTDALGVGTWPVGVVPVLDEVCREADHARLDPCVQVDQRIAVGNVSELALALERGAVPEVRSCIPVHNESCLAVLERAGAKGVWLSPELSLEEVRLLARYASVPVGLMVSGRVRAMTCEHCTLQVAGSCVDDCARCRLREQGASLRNDAGYLFPVRTDVHGRSRVYAAQALDLVPYTTQLLDAGVSMLLIDGTLMDADELVAQVRRVRRALDGERVVALPHTTTGHLFSPIG